MDLSHCTICRKPLKSGQHCGDPICIALRNPRQPRQLHLCVSAQSAPSPSPATPAACPPAQKDMEDDA